MHTQKRQAGNPWHDERSQMPRLKSRVHDVGGHDGDCVRRARRAHRPRRRLLPRSPPAKKKCNAGRGNGSEGCDPGNSSTSSGGDTGQNQGGDEGGPIRRKVRAPRSPRFVTAIEGPASAGLSFPSAARERPVEFPPPPPQREILRGCRGRTWRGCERRWRPCSIDPDCASDPMHQIPPRRQGSERDAVVRHAVAWHLRASPGRTRSQFPRLGGAQRVRRCLAGTTSGASRLPMQRTRS